VFQILDDEAATVVAWNKATETVDETNGPLVVLLAVAASTPPGTVSIPFTLGGTATLGTDYTLQGTSSPLTISGGTSATLLLSINDDTDSEGDETIVVTLGSPTGAVAGTPSAFTLTITDDDGGAGGAGGGGGGSGGSSDSGGNGSSQPAGCSGSGSRPAVAELGLGALAVSLTLRRRRRKH
jgi:hypothetical protein